MPDPLPRPTNAELEILRVLWERGDSTVRDVHDALTAGKPAGEATRYTTILKLLQIMTDKGLVSRDEKERAHVYKPKLAREKTQQAMVGHLLDRVFAGSAADLMMQALASKKTSPKEIRELRELLARYEQEEKGNRK